MVRNYVRKGGHGGSGRNAGLRPGHWAEQGGRKEAAEAKAQREAEAEAESEGQKRKAEELWQRMGVRIASKRQKHCEQEPLSSGKAGSVAEAESQPDMQPECNA